MCVYVYIQSQLNIIHLPDLKKGNLATCNNIIKNELLDTENRQLVVRGR